MEDIATVTLPSLSLSVTPPCLSGRLTDLVFFPILLMRESAERSNHRECPDTTEKRERERGLDGVKLFTRRPVSREYSILTAGNANQTIHPPFEFWTIHLIKGITNN